jgi:hypothetical protein
MEADALYGASDSIASVVGANLAGTRETLERLLEESHQRILRRLDSLGVNENQYSGLLTSIDAIPLPLYAAEGLFALSAEGGSGKSTIAERMHREAIERAASDNSAPLPVFVEARRLDISLDGTINRLWASAPHLPERGVDLIVDGLESIGLHQGRELLLDIRSMVRNPLSVVIRAVVTVRPLDFGLKDEEFLQFQLLSEKQATDIVTRLSGQKYISALYPPMISDAIRRPFFAIAVGLAASEPEKFFRATTSRVIESVVRRAVASIAWEPAAEVLARAAAASVDVRHGPVRLAEVAASQEERSALTSSRLVSVLEGDRVVFEVSLIAEWFAAEHFRRNPDLMTALVHDATRLDLWRYPLLLAIESQDSDWLQAPLTELAIQAPAMAGWLFSQPDPFDVGQLDAMRPEDGLTRDASHVAGQFRVAFGSLAQGLRPASDSLPLFTGGNLVPLWLATHGPRCSYAWHRASPDLPAILEAAPRLDGGLGDEWLTFVDMRTSGHPVWQWREAQQRIRGGLENLIKVGTIFESLATESTIYAKEREWLLALSAVGRRGGLNAAPVGRDELDEVLARRDKLLTDVGLVGALDDRLTSETRHLVFALHQSGVTELCSPWEAPDRLHDPRGFVWGAWSDEGLLERVRKITEAGLRLYASVIDEQLPQFAPHLYLRRDWPVRMIGYMTPASYERGFAGQPQLLWYFDLEATDLGVSWELVDDVDGIARDLYENRRVNRWSGGLLPGLFSPNPATGFAADLLWRDLKEWGWSQGTTPEPIPAFRPFWA